MSGVSVRTLPRSTAHDLVKNVAAFADAVPEPPAKWLMTDVVKECCGSRGDAACLIDTGALPAKDIKDISDQASERYSS
jgi:hypothetical protein